MGSVVEKITLYDLLGYGVPGCVFMGYVLFAQLNAYSLEQLKEAGDFTGLFIFLFLLAGYVAGLLLSELSGFFLKVPARICRDKTLCADVLNIDTETIEAVLRKSGLPECSVENDKDIGKYITYMYSNIQIDPNYHRIHNYASAEVLYKNLGMAFVLGTFVLLCSGSAGLLILGPEILCILLFSRRWYRFCSKKMQYTVLWFTEKYLKAQSRPENV